MNDESFYVCDDCGRLGPMSDFRGECRPGWTHGRKVRVTSICGLVPASRLAEAKAAAERATALAEKYGEAIVKISEALPNVNRARAIIVGLDTAEEA